MQYFIHGEWVECATSQEWRDKLCRKVGATTFDVQVVRGPEHVVTHLFNSYEWPATTEYLTRLLKSWPTAVESDENAAKDWARHIEDLHPPEFFVRLEKLRELQLSIAVARRDKTEVAVKVVKKLTKLKAEIDRRKRNKKRYRK